MLRFPLQLRFKLLSLAPSVYVLDEAGEEVCFIRQKLFRLRESITVYRDSSKQSSIGSIEADRIIDWSARYTFLDADGKAFGAVGRRGARSLWRAHYDIFSAAESKEVTMTIQEENPFVKLIDGLLQAVPIVGPAFNIFSGFFLHPTYGVTARDGAKVARLRKRRAFFEGRFTLEKLGALSPEQEMEILLSCLMMLLLERSRG